MLNPKLKQYISQGYAMLGTVSHKIAINLGRGKDHTRTQLELWVKGLKMLRIIKVLLLHVTFDTNGNPILWRITEEEVNELIACLVKIGELDDYAVYPSLFPTTKPLTIGSGEQGIPGQNGINGLDANIIVRPKDGEEEIIVESIVELGVKTFLLDLVLYIQQQLEIAIPTGVLFEIGDITNVVINLTSTKGSRNITTFTSPDSVINAALQPLFNLTDLNDINDQPVVTVMNVNNQDIDRTFIFKLNDGKTEVTVNSSISFIYPFLSGVSDSSTGFDYYVSFNKTLAVKANRSFILNGSDRYFWIGYPASYGTLSSIRDQNDDEVISDFTTVLVNVNSTGLDNNWSAVSYRFYRTTLKTSISNAPFSITFNS